MTFVIPGQPEGLSPESIFTIESWILGLRFAHLRCAVAHRRMTLMGRRARNDDIQNLC